MLWHMQCAADGSLTLCTRFVLTVTELVRVNFAFSTSISCVLWIVFTLVCSSLAKVQSSGETPTLQFKKKAKMIGRFLSSDRICREGEIIQFFASAAPGGFAQCHGFQRRIRESFSYRLEFRLQRYTFTRRCVRNHGREGHKPQWCFMSFVSSVTAVSGRCDPRSCTLDVRIRRNLSWVSPGSFGNASSREKHQVGHV